MRAEGQRHAAWWCGAARTASEQKTPSVPEVPSHRGGHQLNVLTVRSKSRLLIRR